MRQDFDADVLNDAGLRPLVDAAADLLDAESEGTAMPARATWSVDRPRTGPPVVRVRLEDDTGVTECRLTLEYLIDPLYRRLNVVRLWGHVLANRSERLFRQAVAAVSGEFAA
jgi:hypothetical protein